MTAFGRLPLAARIALIVLGALVALQISETLVAPLGGASGGRSHSSSYATNGTGYAAYAELLSTSGHPITRARSRLDGAALDPGSTLVVADAALSDKENLAVQAFVQAGGRLVLAGESTADTARAVVGENVSWTPRSVSSATPLLPVPEVSGVRGVTSEGSGAWRSTGPATPLLADSSHVLAAVADVGQGRVVLLADASPWQNAHVDEADNAAFGLAVVGPSGRPVVFAETGHSRTNGTGLGALPGPWKAALVAGGIATLLAMWSAARRFGPPEEEARDLPPPRRAYVDALAATLAKTRRPDESLAPLRAAARERLRHRAALGPDATEEQLRQAAAALGLGAEEVGALFGALHTDENGLALGRAMAELGGPSKW